MSTIAEIRKDSKAEGKAEQAELTARVMLHDGKDISEIQRYSGLSAEKIKSIKDEMK